MKTSRDMPGVALLVDTSSGWERRLVQGVLAWAHEHGPWHIWIEPHGQSERLHLPAGWQGEGIIARVSGASMAGDLQTAGVPMVNVSQIQLPGVHEFPRVTTDPDASAELAVRHFRSRGFSQFGYVGSFGLPYVQNHYRAFARRLAREKLDGHVYRGRSGRRVGWQDRLQIGLRAVARVGWCFRHYLGYRQGLLSGRTGRLWRNQPTHVFLPV